MQRVRGRRTEDYLLLGFHRGLGHLAAERLQSEIIRPEVLDVVALRLELSEVALFVLHQFFEDVLGSGVCSGRAGERSLVVETRSGKPFTAGPSYNWGVGQFTPAEASLPRHVAA